MLGQSAVFGASTAGLPCRPVSCAYVSAMQTSHSVGRQRCEHGAGRRRFAVHLLDSRDAVNWLFRVSFVLSVIYCF